MNTTARRAAIFACVLSVIPAAAPAASAKERPRGGEPLVFAHRGASAYRPEHTLSAYRLAIAMGADVIEPDLVSTKDGVLVARHENEIGGTTNVADHAEFADRKTTKTIDGTRLEGWFTEDFTYDELRTLRAKERIPQFRPANTAFDGQFPIPTLKEVIELAQEEGVGIAPETKHPSYFDSIGLSLEEPLVRTLREKGWSKRNAPVYVQSFEVGNLKELDRRIDVPLVQLTGANGKPFDVPQTYAQMTTAAGLKQVAAYADVLGPDKNQIFPRTGTALTDPTRPTSLVRDAHAAGLKVVPYTFRPENTFLPDQFREGNPQSTEYLRARGDAPGELALFMRTGIDGLFADNPDTAVATREHVFGR